MAFGFPSLVFESHCIYFHQDWACSLSGVSCRVVRPDDGIEYECQIRDLLTDEDGHDFAVVDRIGFGDTFTAWREDLMPSHGLEERSAQFEAAKAGTQRITMGI